MKIAVVGSYRDDHPLKDKKPEFIEACTEIGKKLADWRHILIVPHPKDDDTAEKYALAGFKEVHRSRYHQCTEHAGDPALKAHFDAVEKSDAVILIGGQSGTYASGLVALRRRKLVIPIPAFGGSARDLCSISEIESILVDENRNMELSDPDWIAELTHAIRSILDAFPHILIIHGRGDPGEDLKNKIMTESRNPDSPLYGMAEPVIMNLRGKGAVTVPDVFEDLASRVSAAIAIVTADDVGGFARRSESREYSAKELKLEPRARENVWVEVGWFWGRLGRHRVFLWRKDDLELPSDLQGAAEDRHDSLNDAWPSIEAFIKNLRNMQGR